MLKQYEELSVLEQGEDGAIVTVRGQDSPLVMLNAGYLGYLKHLVSRVEVGLSPANKSSSTGLLCAELRAVLAAYDGACNKYYGAPSPAKTISEVMEELNALRAKLEGIGEPSV